MYSHTHTTCMCKEVTSHSIVLTMDNILEALFSCSYRWEGGIEPSNTGVFPWNAPGRPRAPLTPPRPPCSAARPKPDSILSPPVQVWEVAPPAPVFEVHHCWANRAPLLPKDHRKHADGEAPLWYVQKLVGGWAKCLQAPGRHSFGAKYFLPFSSSNATCRYLYLAETSPKILYWNNHSRLIWNAPSSVWTAECMDVLCYIHRKNSLGRGDQQWVHVTTKGHFIG